MTVASAVITSGLGKIMEKILPRHRPDSLQVVFNPFVVVFAEPDVVPDVAEHREGVQWAARLLLVRDVDDEFTRTVRA